MPSTPSEPPEPSEPSEADSLHVALLTRSVVAHFPAGGMELHTEVLRRGLAQRGHAITTLTTQHPNRKIARVADEWGETRFLGTGPSGAYSRAWWRESVCALAQLHARHPIDVVVSQSGAAYGYLRARSGLPDADRLPVVLITHNTVASSLEMQLAQVGSHPFAAARWLPRALPLLVADARLLPRAECVTALSPTNAAALRRWSWVPAERIEIVPNGIDVRACGEAASRRAEGRLTLGVEDGAVLILGMGRLVPGKSFADLLDAFAALVGRNRAPAHLVLVGDGPARGELEARAARLGIGHLVVFTGRVPRERVAPLLWAADVVALPSSAEGVPLTLLEAMACARPVVATRVGGIPDIVADGETGLLVPPRDPPALARALARLMEDRALAASMGARAQARAIAEHDQQAMLDHYECVVRLVASRGLGHCPDTHPPFGVEARID